MSKEKVKDVVKENLETVSNDKFDKLSSFIDATINKDDEGAETAFSEYLILKAKEKMGVIKESDKDDTEEDDEDDEEGGKYAHLLKQRTKKKAPLKKMKKEERGVKEAFPDEDSPVKLKGDDVFVEGKQVGTIENDMNNDDAGITFTSLDGKIVKEFEDLKELYGFLVEHFKVNPTM